MHSCNTLACLMLKTPRTLFLCSGYLESRLNLPSADRAQTVPVCDSGGAGSTCTDVAAGEKQVQLSAAKHTTHSSSSSSTCIRFEVRLGAACGCCSTQEECCAAFPDCGMFSSKKLGLCSRACLRILHQLFMQSTQEKCFSAFVQDNRNVDIPPGSTWGFGSAATNSIRQAASKSPLPAACSASWRDCCREASTPAQDQRHAVWVAACADVST